MSSINLPEIATIALIVLIVFGPKRLPEIARKAGRFAAKARAMVRDAEREMKAEYRGAIEPLKDARRSLTEAGDQLRSTGQDFERDVNRSVKPTSPGGPEAETTEPSTPNGPAPAPGGPVAESPGTSPPNGPAPASEGGSVTGPPPPAEARGVQTPEAETPEAGAAS